MEQTTQLVSDLAWSPFTKLKTISQKIEQHGNGSSPAPISDQLQRLSLWMGNVGARHKPSSPLSLEYRLTGAPEVLRHIRSLLTMIDEIADEMIAVVDQPISHRPEETNQQFQPWRTLLTEIESVIDKLYRAAKLMRTLSPEDLFAKAVTRGAGTLDSERDVLHVQQTCNRLSNPTDTLARRLGEAITERRLYLLYTRKKQQALAKTRPHIIDHDENATTIYSTAATPFPEGTETMVLNPQGLVIPMYDHDDAASFTTFRRSDDGKTATSTKNTIPVLENIPRTVSGDFECPFCRRFVTPKDERQWKAHVYADLRPYVCTFSSCSSKYFGDVNEWFEHEMGTHRREYQCPFTHEGHIGLYADEASFRHHLDTKHGDLVVQGNLEALIAVSSQAQARFYSKDCPCCSDWDPNQPQGAGNLTMSERDVHVSRDRFKRHVASHLEELAFFANTTISSELDYTRTKTGAQSEDLEHVDTSEPRLRIHEHGSCDSEEATGHERQHTVEAFMVKRVEEEVIQTKKEKLRTWLQDLESEGAMSFDSITGAEMQAPSLGAEHIKRPDMATKIDREPENISISPLGNDDGIVGEEEDDEHDYNEDGDCLENDYELGNDGKHKAAESANQLDSFESNLDDASVRKLTDGVRRVSVSSGNTHAPRSQVMQTRQAHTPRSHAASVQMYGIPGTGLYLGPTDQITDPGLLKLYGRGARMRVSETAGSKEKLDRNYKKQTNPKSFFTFGRIFRVLWPEIAGPGTSDMTVVTTTEFEDSPAIMKIRWFVVVLEGEMWCTCLPIATYGKEGLTSKNLPKWQHSIIFSHEEPSPLPGELPQVSERGMLSSIGVQPAYKKQRLDEKARLHYGKFYTIEHYVKVYDFGIVRPEYQRLLYDQWHRVMRESQPFAPERPREQDGPPAPSPHAAAQPNFIDFAVAKRSVRLAPEDRSTGQISMEKNDRLGVIGYPGGGWVQVWCQESGETGLVWRDYILLDSE